MNQRPTPRLQTALQHPLAHVAIAGVIYYAITLICTYLSQEYQHISVWAANAILLTFILRSRSSLTWPYYATGVLASLLVGYTLGNSAYITLTNTLIYSTELLIPILIIDRSQNQTVFIDTLNKDSYILMFSIMLGCAFSSMLASIVYASIWKLSYSNAVFSWFSISLLSMVSILSVGLTASKERLNYLIKSTNLVEFCFLAAFTGFIASTSIQVPAIRYIIILIPLLYCAFRFDLLATTTLCAITASTYVASVFYHGPPISSFVASSPIYTSYSFFFLSLTFLPAIITAALLEQRYNDQEQLSESEQRFRGAFENSALGMALVSLSGRWMMVNKAMCAITGYSEEDLLQITFRDITHRDDIDADSELINKVIKKEINSYQIEKRFIRKNGSTIWISLVVSAIYNEHGQVKYFVGQVENINTRKSMEAALQESEQRWKFALEGGSQGVWDWDIPGKRMYFSRTWKKIIGYRDDEIGNVAEEWFARIHPDEKDIVLQKINEHTELSSEEFQCEHRLKCKSGSYKWVLTRGKAITTNNNGKATRMLGTCTDINALKNAKAEAEKLSQRLLMVLDAGKFGVFTLDLENDHLEWDDRMFEIYDVSQEEFTHNYQAWEQALHPDDLAKTVEQYYAAIGGIEPFDTEFRIKQKNGSYIWIHAKAQVLHNQHDKPTAMLGMNWDITKQKRLIQDIETEKERMHTTLQAIGDAVIVTNAIGNITFINPVAEQLIGTTANQAIGKQFYQICKLVSEKTGESLDDPVSICLENNNPSSVKDEGVLVSQLGMRHYVENTASPIILPSGELTGCVLVLQDMTINRNLQTELQHQASHDVLTGLINRREVEHTIKGLINTERTAKNQHALFFIDLDHFKMVNDTAGHAAGDELLRRVAEMLTQTVRQSDTVARLGGDEFAIILPECNEKDAEQIAKNIIDRIKHYKFTWQDKSYEIGSSIGIVNFTPKSLSIDELISRADIACYAAKHKGGNTTCVYEHSDKETEQYQSEIQLFPKIKQALYENKFKLHTQAIKPINNNGCKPYYEVLLRLQDDNGELILPSLILKTAERHKIISDIDNWVINEILFNKAAQINECAQLELSINISPSSINSPEFITALDTSLTNTSIDTSRIGFELKEAVFLSDIDSALTFLHVIEKHNCFISMDNFAKGLSSFQYLKNFHKLFIKIDGELIRTITENEVDRAIVESINSLAHKLGAKTIAEYVEHEEIITLAKDIGIDYAQGFAISQIRPIDAVLDEMRAPELTD